mgnify:CR=1 FL=1
MKRREFVTALGVGAAGAVLAGCTGSESGSEKQQASAKQETIKWKMVTTWPKNFPGLGTAANSLAEKITKMSGGRLEVKVFGAGELVNRDDDPPPTPRPPKGVGASLLRLVSFPNGVVVGVVLAL